MCFVKFLRVDVFVTDLIGLILIYVVPTFLLNPKFGPPGHLIKLIRTVYSRELRKSQIVRWIPCT